MEGEKIVGLFSFLKKKPEKLPVSVNVEAKTSEVEVRQRTPGELPLAYVGEYESPSGGFVNYGRFRVVGVNRETGRKNTRKYEAQSEKEARALAAADGLADPMEISAEQMDVPSERQVAYALDLEATLPEGACKEDVSAIISRITDEDEDAPDPGLSLWAHESGVRFSRFIGARALLGCMMFQMADVEKATLYAYAVYLQENGGRFSDPRKLHAFPVLLRCAEQVAGDPGLMKSLGDRDSSDLFGPNRGTKIYKATASILRDGGAIR